MNYIKMKNKLINKLYQLTCKLLQHCKVILTSLKVRLALNLYIYTRKLGNKMTIMYINFIVLKYNFKFRFFFLLKSILSNVINFAKPQFLTIVSLKTLINLNKIKQQLPKILEVTNPQHTMSSSQMLSMVWCSYQLVIQSQ